MSRLKSFLDDLVDFSMPALIAAGSIFLFEMTGIPKALQDYEMSNFSLNKEDFLFYIKTGRAYMFRGLVDVLPALGGYFSAPYIKTKLRAKPKTRRVNFEEVDEI